MLNGARAEARGGAEILAAGIEDMANATVKPLNRQAIQSKRPLSSYHLLTFQPGYT